MSNCSSRAGLLYMQSLWCMQSFCDSSCSTISIHHRRHIYFIFSFVALGSINDGDWRALSLSLGLSGKTPYSVFSLSHPNSFIFTSRKNHVLGNCSHTRSLRFLNICSKSKSNSSLLLGFYIYKEDKNVLESPEKPRNSASNHFQLLVSRVYRCNGFTSIA